MPLWLYALTAFGAVAVVGDILGAPAPLVFAAACLGLIPLAGLIGHATGQLAVYLGPHWGGLLNATFGNAAELIITLLALREGLIVLVKASITGSIIGNTLLVLGLALLAGGSRHGLLKFDQRLAGLNAALMILAVAGLLLPRYSVPWFRTRHASKSSASSSRSCCCSRIWRIWSSFCAVVSRLLR